MSADMEGSLRLMMKSLRLLNDEEYAISGKCDSHHNLAYSRAANMSSNSESARAETRVQFASASSSRPRLLQLFVRVSESRTVSILLSDDQTGKDLYSIVESRTGIPTDQQLLFYKNRKVTKSDTLFKQNFTTDSTLVLSIALAGGSDEELSEKNLRRLARWLSDMWKELAYELDIRSEEVRTLEADNPGKVVEQGFQMLCQWRQKKGIAANAADLIAALREIEMNEVADKFVERLTGVPGPYNCMKEEKDTVVSPSAGLAGSANAAESCLNRAAGTATNFPPVLEEIAVGEQLLALGNDSEVADGEEGTSSSKPVELTKCMKNMDINTNSSPHHTELPASANPLDKVEPSASSRPLTSLEPPNTGESASEQKQETVNIQPSVSAEPPATVQSLVSMKPSPPVKPLATVESLVTVQPSAIVQPLVSTEQSTTAQPSTTVEPLVSTKPSVTAQASAVLQPLVSAEPSATVEPLNTAELSAIAKGSNTAEPSDSIELSTSVVPQYTAMLTKLEQILAAARSDHDNVNILIANAVPESLRGSQSLQFLLDFSWSAVLDFDASSEDGGLQSFAGTVPDPLQSKVKIMEIKQFLEKSITNHPAEIGLHSKRKPWVFTNGRKQFDSQPETFVSWMQEGYRKALDTALATYQTYCPCLMFIIFVLSGNDLQHLATTVESLFSQQLTKHQSFYILSVDAELCRKLLELSRISKQLKQFCFVLPLEDIKAAFMSTSSTVLVASESIEEVRLPTSDGGNVKVPLQKLRKWEDLDILSTTQCAQRDHSLQEIQAAEESFYKGHEPTWLNFFHRHDIPRTECVKYLTCIKEQLKQLMNMQAAGPERLAVTSVRTVVISHQSGSGGTTVGRRLLWELRDEYRCAVLTRLSDATRKAIHDFQVYGESMVPQSQLKPLVLLADGHAVINLGRLLLQLDRGNVKCVVICVQAKQSRLLVFHGRGSEQSDVSHDFPTIFVGFVKLFELPERLDKAELNRVKNIIKKLKGTDGKRVADSVEQSKLFIYLGLELFGGNYDPRRLKKFVRYHMEAADTTTLHQKMLRYCSLVYNFSRKAIPRGCFHFKRPGHIFIGGGFEVDPLTPSVSDLLLECNEQLDPPSDACYTGYRPAHALVAQEILQQTFRSTDQSLPTLCHRYLQDMFQGTDYATRHLMDLTILLFRKRAHSSEITEQEDDSSPLEFQDQRQAVGHHRLSSQHNRWQRENRYSSLITAVLTSNEDDPEECKFNALKLIFSLCETVIIRERDDTAYVWQLMARLLAYEYQEEDIQYVAAVQLSELLGPEAHGTELVPYEQDCKVVSGCTAAIICINQAIKLLPNNTYLHATKGLSYKLMLYGRHHGQVCSQEELSDCVGLADKSCESYEKARVNNRFNWHAYLGDIEACITLLGIAKDTQFFRRHEVVGENNRDFLRFLEGKRTPSALAEDVHTVSFLQSVKTRIEHLFDKFFEQENTIKECGHGEDVLIKWRSARDRMNEMQRKFYAIIERKLELRLLKAESTHMTSTKWCEGNVRDILLQCSETAYSPWQNVDEEEMQRMIQLLKGPVMRSGGEGISDFCKVAFVRACLECQKKPDLELESRLPFMVQQWVDHCQDFEWAHYFNYMLHFPHENSLPCSEMKVVKRSLQACQKCIQKYGESKKSKPRYFLGQGRGLGAFVPASALGMLSANQAAQDYKTKTDFWRSVNVAGALVRLWGYKFKPGHIRYREDLMIKFDNALFPETSQERVYFYVGFTFHGLYAFDPLSEEDLIDVLRQQPPADPNPIAEEPDDGADSVITGTGTDLANSDGLEHPKELLDTSNGTNGSVDSSMQTSKEIASEVVDEKAALAVVSSTGEDGQFSTANARLLVNEHVKPQKKPVQRGKTPTQGRTAVVHQSCKDGKSPLTRKKKTPTKEQQFMQKKEKTYRPKVASCEQGEEVDEAQQFECSRREKEQLKEGLVMDTPDRAVKNNRDGTLGISKQQQCNLLQKSKQHVSPEKSLLRTYNYQQEQSRKQRPQQTRKLSKRQHKQKGEATHSNVQTWSEDEMLHSCSEDLQMSSMDSTDVSRQASMHRKEAMMNCSQTGRTEGVNLKANNTTDQQVLAEQLGSEIVKDLDRMALEKTHDYAQGEGSQLSQHTYMENHDQHECAHVCAPSDSHQSFSSYGRQQMLADYQGEGQYGHHTAYTQGYRGSSPYMDHAASFNPSVVPTAGSHHQYVDAAAGSHNQFMAPAASSCYQYMDCATSSSQYAMCTDSSLEYMKQFAEMSPAGHTHQANLLLTSPTSAAKPYYQVQSHGQKATGDQRQSGYQRPSLQRSSLSAQLSQEYHPHHQPYGQTQYTTMSGIDPFDLDDDISHQNLQRLASTGQQSEKPSWNESYAKFRTSN